MKKYLPCLFLTLLVFTLNKHLYAQQPTADIYERNMAITIDGIPDEWAAISTNFIDRPFRSESPTLNSAIWKAVWDDEAIYLDVEVDDDIWIQTFLSDSWLVDGVELYFDVSNPQQDGGGPKDPDERAAGNYQIAPDMIQSQSKPYTFGRNDIFPGTVYANTYNGTGIYCIEYKVPWKAILQNNQMINPNQMSTIGFDVTVVDMDSLYFGPRPNIRAVWANNGPDESWNNCDNVGLITFKPNRVDESEIKVNLLVSNLVTNQLTLNIDVYQLTIMDLAGDIVLSYSKLSEESIININALKSGIYLISAKTVTGKKITDRFVKLE